MRIGSVVVLVLLICSLLTAEPTAPRNSLSCEVVPLPETTGSLPKLPSVPAMGLEEENENRMPEANEPALRRGSFAVAGSLADAKAAVFADLLPPCLSVRERLNALHRQRR